MQVGVVADSTCDLPAARLRRLGVAAVPLRLSVGDEVYLDWRDLDPTTVYEWMGRQGVAPQTLPPEPEDFMHAYREQLRRFDSLVSIHADGRVADTASVGRRAAERLGEAARVHILETGLIGAALAEVVLAAAGAARGGAPPEAVLAAAERVRGGVFAVFSPTSARWLELEPRWRGLRDRRRRLLGRRPLLTLSRDGLATLAWERSEAVAEALARQLALRFGSTEVCVAVSYAGTERGPLERLRLAVEDSGLVIASGRVQLIGPALGAQIGAGGALVAAHPCAAPAAPG